MGGFFVLKGINMLDIFLGPLISSFVSLGVKLCEQKRSIRNCGSFVPLVSTGFRIIDSYAEDLSSRCSHAPTDNLASKREYDSACDKIRHHQINYGWPGDCPY